SVRFEGLEPGDYALDYGPYAAPFGAARRALPVRDGDNHFAQRTCRLGGLLVRVRTAGGQPVAGSTVVADERYLGSWTARTGPDGVAEFPHLPVGSFRVSLLDLGAAGPQTRIGVFARTTPEALLVLD
ncbi:MAG TPA: carboxypeptidase-like regulatory domain-containing protein, partial [Planctomycetota bacterium]